MTLCLICRKLAENHHIKTRGAGGTDDHWNLALLCRAHHQEIHSRGLSTFAEKYPKFKAYLHSMGWDFDGKWRRNEPTLKKT